MEKTQINFKKVIEELMSKYNSSEINGKIINDFLEEIAKNSKTNN